MPKVSIITPIYKMEKYLDRAFESLQSQTFKDFEAVFVDDGSPDESGEMCDKFAKLDSRIHVIHQENGGVSKARNTALDNACGEYLFFLDPDDWIEPNTLEVLVDIANKENADMVMFGMFEDCYDGNGKLICSNVQSTDFEGVFRHDPFKNNFEKIATSHLIITKMMRRSIIVENKCRFSNLNIGEDGVFFADFYRNNPQCFVAIKTPLYHYTSARLSSLSNSYHPERDDKNFVLSDTIIDVVREWGLLESPKHLRTLEYVTIRDLQMGIKNIGLCPKSHKYKCDWIKKIVSDKWIKSAIKNTDLSMIKSRNDKIKLLLLKLHLYHTLVLLSSANQKK